MLRTRITEQYGLKVPFINAGMAFIATAIVQHGSADLKPSCSLSPSSSESGFAYYTSPVFLIAYGGGRKGKYR
jgi:hypothetical protein